MCFHSGLTDKARTYPCTDKQCIVLKMQPSGRYFDLDSRGLHSCELQGNSGPGGHQALLPPGSDTERDEDHRIGDSAENRRSKVQFPCGGRNSSSPADNDERNGSEGRVPIPIFWEQEARAKAPYDRGRRAPYECGGIKR